ncbi:MAG TPA: terminase [Desulfobacteraceae bacterium]|nr:terminase [Desulfobacteraceae bacterium]|tara:strand:+ start:1611 stop:2894 length:1284 start_codon:yes stop_codon:yes gene_type:complete
MQDSPTVKVEANIPQAIFLSMPQKFRGFVGGFGSSKTFSGCMAMCQHFYEWPGINQGYFAPTFPHIRDIFYPTIDEVSHLMGLNVDIKEGNKEVHFYSGGAYRGTAICRSMDRPQYIVGFKIGHALADELDILTIEKARTAWRKIIARMRYKVSGLKNGVDVTTTPEGFKFVYQLFVKALAENPSLRQNYGLIQASTYDNEENLPEDYIPSLVEAYPPELIAAYLEGQFVNLTSGTVYRAYDRNIHNSSETIQENEPLYIGMDFNVQHMAATIYVQRGKQWHAVAELKDVFDTPEIISIIKERWQDKKHSITIYPDATGKNRKSNNASESDILLLKHAKFKIKAKASNPAVKDRVQATNKALHDGILFVNADECPTVATSLEQQAYDSNGEPDKSSGFDHQNDATTYPVAYEMPIKRPTTTTQSVRL